MMVENCNFHEFQKENHGNVICPPYHGFTKDFQLNFGSLCVMQCCMIGACAPMNPAETVFPSLKRVVRWFFLGNWGRCTHTMWNECIQNQQSVHITNCFQRLVHWNFWLFSGLQPMFKNQNFCAVDFHIQQSCWDDGSVLCATDFSTIIVVANLQISPNAR